MPRSNAQRKGTRKNGERAVAETNLWKDEFRAALEQG